FLVRAWQLEGRALPLVVCGLMIFHPLQAELATFKIAVFYLGFGLATVLLAARVAHQPKGRAVATGLLVLALGTYQTVLNHLAEVVLFGMLLPGVRSRADRPWRAAVRQWLPIVLAMMLAFVAYLVWVRVALAVTYVKPTGRFGVLPSEAWPQRVTEVKAL